MSETLAEAAEALAPVADPPAPEAPAEPVVQETTTEEPESAPEAPPKPKQGDRRFAAMTAKVATEAARADAAEAGLAAAQALLNANKPDQQPATREPTVEQKAQELLDEREFTRKISAIDLAGKKEFGSDAWEDAKNTLTSLGASTNTAFLTALAETEHPQKVFAALAEDTDTLLDLMKLSPAAMAARLGRMDAKMATSTTTTPVKPLSAAPRPPSAVKSGGVDPAPVDPLDYEATQDMSMAEWSKLFDNSPAGKRILRRRA